MTNQQGAPEALRLAEQYDHGDPAAHGNAWKAAVCNELRRLHSEVTTLQAELAAMRAGGEPVAEMVPYYIPSGKRVAVISRFQHLPIGTKLYTQPAPTPQADSQPAQVEVADAMADSQYLAGVSAGWNAANADDPNEALRKLHESRAGYLKPLSAARAQADIQPALDEATAMNRTRELAESGRWPSDWVEAYRRGYSDRASSAPADSVLEDAARYRWVRGPVEESTRYSRWRIEYWDGPNGWQPMQRERMDSAIDAARKQGGA